MQDEYYGSLQGRPEPPLKAPGLIVGTKLKAFLLVVGFFVLGMLVMIPTWSAFLMLQDPITNLFIGPFFPKAILGSCLGVLAGFLVVTMMFFACARTEAINEQTLLMMGNVFLVALGTCLVLISMPLRTKSLAVGNSLFSACELGKAEGSFELYQTSQVLQALRKQPTCIDKVSIEACKGYEPTQYTNVLKAMEDRLHCSGFCYNPEGVNATGLIIAEEIAGEGNSTAADGVLAPQGAFLQVGSAANARQRDQAGAVAVARGSASTASAKGSLAAATALAAQGANAAAGIFLPYPPTLFSKANYEASCDGMAARHIQYGPGEVATQLFYEGVFLTLTSLVVGLLKLCGMCIKDRHVRKLPMHYQ